MNKIFVFGSNEAGIHGKGAALYARQHYGARPGIGNGLTGFAYAIPTKDHNIRTLPLNKIFEYVKEFIKFAEITPHLTYEITRIGCGLAGYKDTDIAPMFRNCPSNCNLPEEFKQVLDKLAESA